MEEAIRFRNRDGRHLFGVVHLPEGGETPNRGIGVNLLNPGIKYRVAPNRLYVKLARELCRQGYTVLRFDPEGVGDSEGELPGDVPVGEIWGMIQRGRFVPDALDANDYFLRRYGVKKLLLMGNCGGAITALLTAAEDARVSGLCLVDVPVFLWYAGRSFADRATPGGGKLNWLFTEYLRRIASPTSWYRFLTLQTDYAALAKVIRMKAAERLRPATRTRRVPENFEEVCQKNNLNPAFFRSYEQCVQSGRPICFVMAGNDPGIDLFRQHFLGWYLAEQRRPMTDSLLETRVIEDANHVYTLTEWQQALIRGIVGWLDKNEMLREARKS